MNVSVTTPDSKYYFNIRDHIVCVKKGNFNYHESPLTDIF